MPAANKEIELMLTEGTLERQCSLSHVPYTIGRLQDRDLILTHPYVSREHAEIIREGAGYCLVDSGSRHGTYVNGARVQRVMLKAGDQIRFGSQTGPLLEFDYRATSTSSIRELLGQFDGPKNNDIEKLRWFLEAARKLNSGGAVEQILAALVETTLQLTDVERGYVFLLGPDGKLKLTVGRSATGEVLSDDSAVSHSAMQQALGDASEFIATDTLSAGSHQRSESVVAQSIRTIVAIPLRSRRKMPAGGVPENLGVLYLDDRLKVGKLTKVDSDLLHTIATEAAALVENANLALEEEAARVYRQELNIAADIQQGLMAVRIPELPFARISARSVPCKEIGGDFFDVVSTPEALYVVLTDVSGKGVSAALLASTLQGMVYSQLASGQPLPDVALLANRFICNKSVGKYATMAMVRLTRDGQMEYINCGHIPPVHIRDCNAANLEGSNLPVGLISAAEYKSEKMDLRHGDRVLLVSDGVTEAEDPAGEFFGEGRLLEAAGRCESLEEIFADVVRYCDGAPSTDDCTMLEIFYSAPASA